MKNSNKLLRTISILYLFLFLFSCSSSNESIEENSKLKLSLVVKKWILTNDLTAESPTIVIMSIEKNGYFQIYDSIIDTKFTDAGISKIQSISKGQWKTEDNKLILNHFSPENKKPEVFNIKTLTTNKLITIGSNKKVHSYKAK